MNRFSIKVRGYSAGFKKLNELLRRFSLVFSVLPVALKLDFGFVESLKYNS